MSVTVLLTALGSDRPGLTRTLADAVLAAGGDWLESQLARMGGKFVGAALVRLPAAQDVERLEQALRAIDPSSLTVALVPAKAEAPAPGLPLRLELMGQDHPGIVRDVTAVLAELGVNIEAVETGVEPAAWSGGALFRMKADLLAPPDLGFDTIQEALERISAEIMVDVVVAAREPAVSVAHAS